MKAILEFNLPEDQAEHSWAVNAFRMASVISEVMNETRSWLKHGHNFKTPDEAIEAVREMLAEVVGIAQGE